MQRLLLLKGGDGDVAVFGNFVSVDIVSRKFDTDVSHRMNVHDSYLCRVCVHVHSLDLKLNALVDDNCIFDLAVAVGLLLVDFDFLVAKLVDSL